MSKKLKLTPWFPVSIAPTRVGAYETKSHREGTYFSHWDGEQFNGEWYTPARAANNTRWCFGSSFTHWRGLAVKHG